MSMLRFSKKKGEREYKFHDTTRSRIQVVAKEVHIGQHAPTTHFTAASHQFIPATDLYDARHG